ncbi:Membrane protein [Leifsonia rubra CMS 76R]|nr:Membrane protein [Leifsonia rubra CMS 76R]
MIRTVVCTLLSLALVTLSGTATRGASATTWDWPVADPHPIVRPYIAPETPYSAGHRGIDIAVGPIAEARAPTAGVVHFVGTVVDRPVLSIRHPNGLISSYEPVTSTLTRGDAVARGQVIGEVQAGHCVSICLHFGVRLDGDYVSPLNYLSEIPRAVLLPTRAPP